MKFIDILMEFPPTELLFIKRRRLLSMAVILVAIIFEPLVGYSQINNKENTINENIAIADQLPSIDSLITMAVAYHPTVRLNQELEGAAEQRMIIAKRSWSNLIRGYADYSTGNQSIITTGMQANDINNFANGYRTGINLSIPFSEIYSRKAKIKLQQQELNAAAYKTQEMEIAIAHLVIEEYNNMVTAQKLMKFNFEMQEKSRANLQTAELEYKSGNMEGAVYIRNVEIFNIAQIDYQNSRKEFAIATQKLELLIGVPLSQIIRSK